MRKLEDSQAGFWGTVARKAKAILEDDFPPGHVEAFGAVHQQEDYMPMRGKDGTQYQAAESTRKPERAVLRKGFGAIASSFNYIGNALEEGLNKVENRTVDIIQETRSRRSNIRKTADPDFNKQPMNAGCAKDLYAAQRQTNPAFAAQSQMNPAFASQKQTNPAFASKKQTNPAFAAQKQMNPALQSDLDIQVQASRDVAMAMAAKTKLLLRELKTVKADLAFAKERCAQLEKENRILRESMEKGDNPEDDDLIRLQLESLLAEKARLAQENTLFARENRFLREVVEYHQLTMQDVVYLNERSEEITEVYPAKVPSMTDGNTVTTMPSLSPSLQSPELVKEFDL